eukprot:Platyproteum_vivax@DN3350_c0_g1_i1.p1
MPSVPSVDQSQRQRKYVSDQICTYELIGKGANGEVYAAGYYIKDRYVPNVVAKCLKRHKTASREQRFLKSHEIIQSISHPHIAKVHHVEVHSNCYWTVLDRFYGKDVIDYVVENSPGSLPIGNVKRVLQQLLQAVDCLHRNNLVHCDIKLDNLRFKEPLDGSGLFDIVLLDFDDCNTATQKREAGMPVGTLQYLAPEILNGLHTSARDVWSVGVTMYVMMEGYFPWDIRPAQEAAAKVGARVSWPMLSKIFSKNPALQSKVWKSDKEGFDLVKALLCRDHKNRITAEKALEHPWFDSLKKCATPVMSHKVCRTPPFGNCTEHSTGGLSVPYLAYSLLEEDCLQVPVLRHPHAEESQETSAPTPTYWPHTIVGAGIGGEHLLDL